MSGTTSLRKMGLLNAETWGEDVIATPPVIRPFCSSQRCGGTNGKLTYKSVPGSPDRCPDCGHSLFYRKIKKDFN